MENNVKKNYLSRRAPRFHTQGNLALAQKFAPESAQRPHLYLVSPPVTRRKRWSLKISLGLFTAFLFLLLALPLTGGPTYVTKDSFGNIVSQAGLSLTQQPYTYTGRPFDTIDGTYNLRARSYDASTGRFTQEDPIRAINQYAYVLDNPVIYTDPTGEDIWIEGPSGREPPGHVSINVGNPNGNYDSYSFGVNGGPWLQGEVYRDTTLWGQIDPNHYLKTTPAEDAIAKAHLDSLVGKTAPYRPWRFCRTFSLGQFNRFKSQGIGRVSTPPPDRIGRSHRPYTLPWFLWPSVTDPHPSLGPSSSTSNGL